MRDEDARCARQQAVRPEHLVRVRAWVRARARARVKVRVRARVKVRAGTSGALWVHRARYSASEYCFCLPGTGKPVTGYRVRVRVRARPRGRARLGLGLGLGFGRG